MLDFQSDLLFLFPGSGDLGRRYPKHLFGSWSETDLWPCETGAPSTTKASHAPAVGQTSHHFHGGGTGQVWKSEVWPCDTWIHSVLGSRSVLRIVKILQVELPGWASPQRTVRHCRICCVVFSDTGAVYPVTGALTRLMLFSQLHFVRLWEFCLNGDVRRPAVTALLLRGF